MNSVASVSRRAAVFLTATFLITWTSWWGLGLLARSGATTFGQPLFMTLYLIGGFGPTIGAYVAVIATRDQAPVGEFHRRLLRWRVAPRWWAVALGLPFLIASVAVVAALQMRPGFRETLAIRSWYWVVPLFFGMIVGGGLEELGWRGVAQPELERRMSRAGAALLIGIVWALWHLPLFSIPGVSQYGESFPIFAVSVVGGAFVLAWLYGHTTSILLCVVFHAALNTAMAMGLMVPSRLAGPALVGAVVEVIIGVTLVFASRPAARP